MLSKRRRNLIFVEALVLTIFIYLFAVIINGYFDDSREETLNKVFYSSELKMETYYALNDFLFLNNMSCETGKNLLFDREESLKSVGTDLTNYGKLFLDINLNKSLIKERKYYLDELELFSLANEYNELCDDKIFIVLYFFNGFSTSLDKQSLILDQFSLNNENKSMIFSFDINYEREALVNIIKNKYNVNFVPFIIIGNKTTREFEHDKDLVVDINSITIEYKKFKGQLK